jgi:hypothetical protein
MSVTNERPTQPRRLLGPTLGGAPFGRLLPERSPSPVYGAGLLNRLGC